MSEKRTLGRDTSGAASSSINTGALKKISDALGVAKQLTMEKIGLTDPTAEAAELKDETRVSLFFFFSLSLFFFFFSFFFFHMPFKKKVLLDCPLTLFFYFFIFFPFVLETI